MIAFIMVAVNIGMILPSVPVLDKINDAPCTLKEWLAVASFSTGMAGLFVSIPMALSVGAQL